MIALWLATTAALAQDLVPTYADGEERAWKLEVYAQRPNVPETPNHLTVAAEAWSGKLTCAVAKNRTHTCRFEDDALWYAWWPTVQDDPEYVPIQAPVTIALRFTPTGRIAAIDVSGDTVTFRRSLALAHGSRVREGMWRLDSPDFQRRLGQELERRVVPWLVAGLDVDLPRKGDDRGVAWKAGSMPQAMKRLQNTVGGSKVELSVASRLDDGAVIVALQGEGSITGSGGTTYTLPVTTTPEQTFNLRIQGRALMAPDNRRVLASEIWTVCWSTLPLLGFEIYTHRATAWADDLQLKPQGVPAVPGE